jgi:hypothetical protein
VQSGSLNVWEYLVIEHSYIWVTMWYKLQVIFLANSVKKISPLWEHDPVLASVLKNIGGWENVCLVDVRMTGSTLVEK